MVEKYASHLKLLALFLAMIGAGYACEPEPRFRVGHCYILIEEQDGANNDERWPKEWRALAVGQLSAILETVNGGYNKTRVNRPMRSVKSAVEVDCSRTLDDKAITRCEDACKEVNLPLKREEVDNAGNLTLCTCGGSTQ